MVIREIKEIQKFLKTFFHLENKEHVKYGFEEEKNSLLDGLYFF